MLAGLQAAATIVALTSQVYSNDARAADHIRWLKVYVTHLKAVFSELRSILWYATLHRREKQKRRKQKKATARAPLSHKFN